MPALAGYVPEGLLPADSPIFGIEQPARYARIPIPAPPRAALPGPSCPRRQPRRLVAPQRIVLTPGPPWPYQRLAAPDTYGRFLDVPQGDAVTKYYLPRSLVTIDELDA